MIDLICQDNDHVEPGQTVSYKYDSGIAVDGAWINIQDANRKYWSHDKLFDYFIAPCVIDSKYCYAERHIIRTKAWTWSDYYFH